MTRHEKNFSVILSSASGKTQLILLTTYIKKTSSNRFYKELVLDGECLFFLPQLIVSFSFCRSACDQRHLERKNLRGHTFGFNQTR